MLKNMRKYSFVETQDFVSLRLTIMALVVCTALLTLPVLSNLHAAKAADDKAAQPVSKLLVLCYHDVIEKSEDFIITDTMPVLIKNLVDDFEWIKNSGYTPVSIKDILDAEKGLKKLPEKAIMITFDDGYRSFYDYVFPLAETYKFPVLLALETGWLETPYSKLVEYGDDTVSRNLFLSWPQIREMAKSKYIYFATHSHDMHKGIQANPQGNLEPAPAVLRYFPEKNRYETVAEYEKRIYDDLVLSKKIITEKSGKDPVAVVWPYGHFTSPAVTAAHKAGFHTTFSLATTNKPENLLKNGVLTDSKIIKRHLMSWGESAADAVKAMNNNAENMPVQRVVHVDLDYVYSQDPDEQERHLGMLLDRLEALKPTTVYLQAYVDNDGKGTAGALYFPNRHLPIKADLFNRVAWQIFSRIKADVYAWMPVMGFDLGSDEMTVQADPADKAGSVYRRLSPFDPKAKKIIKEIYSDLARNSYFSGILYHDDAILGDYEDFSPAGKAWLVKQGLPTSSEKIRSSDELRTKFWQAKNKALIDFTNELTETVKVWRPEVRTARNIYATPILDSNAREWFSQDLETFINNYDYTAIEAMPYMENASDPEKWLKNLVEAVKANPNGINKTVLELQTVDWKINGKKISGKTLAAHMKLLQSLGIKNYGYYPDDFIQGHPDTDVVYPYFSSNNNRFLKGK